MPRNQRRISKRTRVRRRNTQRSRKVQKGGLGKSYLKGMGGQVAEFLKMSVKTDVPEDKFCHFLNHDEIGVITTNRAKNYFGDAQGAVVYRDGNGKGQYATFDTINNHLKNYGPATRDEFRKLKDDPEKFFCRIFNLDYDKMVPQPNLVPRNEMIDRVHSGYQGGAEYPKTIKEAIERSHYVLQDNEANARSVLDADKTNYDTIFFGTEDNEVSVLFRKDATFNHRNKTALESKTKLSKKLIESDGNGKFFVGGQPDSEIPNFSNKGIITQNLLKVLHGGSVSRNRSISPVISVKKRNFSNIEQGCTLITQIYPLQRALNNPAYEDPQPGEDTQPGGIPRKRGGVTVNESYVEFQPGQQPKRQNQTTQLGPTNRTTQFAPEQKSNLQIQTTQLGPGQQQRVGYSAVRKGQGRVNPGQGGPKRAPMALPSGEGVNPASVETSQERVGTHACPEAYITHMRLDSEKFNQFNDRGEFLIFHRDGLYMKKNGQTFEIKKDGLNRLQNQTYFVLRRTTTSPMELQEMPVFLVKSLYTQIYDSTYARLHETPAASSHYNTADPVLSHEMMLDDAGLGDPTAGYGAAEGFPQLDLQGYDASRASVDQEPNNQDNGYAQISPTTTSFPEQDSAQAGVDQESSRSSLTEIGSRVPNTVAPNSSGYMPVIRSSPNSDPPAMQGQYSRTTIIEQINAITTPEQLAQFVNRNPSDISQIIINKLGTGEEITAEYLQIAKGALMQEAKKLTGGGRTQRRRRVRNRRNRSNRRSSRSDSSKRKQSRRGIRTRRK